MTTLALLLMLAGVLVALPAVWALAGPDEDEEGSVTPGRTRGER